MKADTKEHTISYYSYKWKETGETYACFMTNIKTKEMCIIKLRTVVTFDIKESVN